MRAAHALCIRLGVFLAALGMCSGCMLDWTAPAIADASDVREASAPLGDVRDVGSAVEARDQGSILDATEVPVSFDVRDGGGIRDVGSADTPPDAREVASAVEAGDSGSGLDQDASERDAREVGCASCSDGGPLDRPDGVADASADVIQTPPLTVATASLPGGTTQASYAFAVSATGGVSPYTWSVTSGALPAGLTLNATTGTITGTPSAVGTASFVLQVMDTLGQTASRPLSIAVTPSGVPPLSLLTTALPVGVVGASYVGALAASGGTQPYQWSVSSGALPAGLSLGATSGTIAGVPSTAGSVTFSVAVKDQSGLVAEASLTIAISPVLSIASASLPDGKEGAAYSATVVASGGRSPLSFVVTSGTLPAGLALDAGSGLLHGTPSAGSGGDYAFQVTVTDATSPSQSATAKVSLRIVGPLAISTTTLAVATTGKSYQATLKATGGIAPYAWSRASGTLPPGLALTAAGAVQGTPTAAGSYVFTVTVVDSSSPQATAQRQLTLVVANPLAVQTTTLAAGTLGEAYAATLAATGGTSPYRWSAKSGTLPSGLTLTSGGSIAGTPTQAGTFTFSATVTDANSNQADSGTLSITIRSPLTIVTTTLPSTTRGATYSATLQASGGNAPYTWSVSNGTLPRNLTLQSSTGVISGTVSTRIAAGTTTRFTVQVTDSSTPAQQKTAQLSITVN